MLALRCFANEKGSLPESPSDLVPKYLDGIPSDPADDEPLRYSREKRIIYSIGSDNMDSGGSAEVDPAKARDDATEPTFRIEF